MDLNLAGMSIPVSGLNCFDTLSILVLVPVFDGVRDDNQDGSDDDNDDSDDYQDDDDDVLGWVEKDACDGS